MYPLVGAINHRNRFTLDLGFGTIRLAVVTDQDLTKVQDHRKLRGQIAEALNGDGALKQELLDIRARLGEVSASFRGSTPMIVVIQEGRLTQAVYDSPVFLNKVGTVRERHSVDQQNKTSKLSTTDSLLLPGLQVHGDKIVRQDTGAVVQLKGVQIHNPLHDTSQEPLSASFLYMQVAKLWGADLIRLPIYSEGIDGHTGELRQIVEFARSNGTYVIITPSSWKGPYNDIAYPNDSVIRALGKLAEMFKNDPHVILDIWNEVALPGGDAQESSNQVLREVVQKAIGIIRQAGFRGIIGVPGIEHSHNFTWLQSYSGDSNIMVGVTDAPWEVTDNRVLSRREEWQFMLGRCAVFLREFNFGSVTQYNQTPREAKWMRQSLEIVNQHGLSYTGFHMDFWDPVGFLTNNPAHGKKVAGAGPYYLTTRGQVVFEDLQAHPPTQFDQ